MKRVVAVLVVLASFSVFAQTEKPTTEAPSDARRDHKFGDGLIKTAPDAPAVPVIYSYPSREFPSLIKVRANFQPELQNSVQELN